MTKKNTQDNYSLWKGIWTLEGLTVFRSSWLLIISILLSIWMSGIVLLWLFSIIAKDYTLYGAELTHEVFYYNNSSVNDDKYYTS